jgi:hypothetical protein
MMTTKAKVQTQHAMTNIIQFPAKRLVEREGRLRDRRIKECNPLQPIDKGRKTQIAALFIDDVEDAPHCRERPPTMKQVWFLAALIAESPMAEYDYQWLIINRPAMSRGLASKLIRNYLDGNRGLSALLDPLPPAA